jgi:hypothetical protein
MTAKGVIMDPRLHFGSVEFSLENLESFLVRVTRPHVTHYPPMHQFEKAHFWVFISLKPYSASNGFWVDLEEK